MSFHIVVLARDKKTEEGLLQEISVAFSAAVALSPVSVDIRAGSDLASLAGAKMVFIDGERGGLPGFLEECLSRIDRRGCAVCLVLAEDSAVPAELLSGQVDDVLIRPFRPLEILGKLKHYQQLLLWDEVVTLNTSFSELLGRMQDDLQLAERLQKARLPIRFDDIRGFKVSHRYLAGMRSGGDYFDLAESADQNLLSMVLSDSSSYGLSSAVLSVLMRVALKLSAEQARSTHETMRRVHEELRLVLGERDTLSLFYGVLSRKDYKLRYLSRGTACVFYADPGGSFRGLPSQGKALSRFSESKMDAPEGELQLDPEGRLVVLSDGFLELAGGAQAIEAILNERRASDSLETLNELVFQVKSKLAPDDLPAQDCTAAIFDVDSKILRMARG